MGYRAFAIIIFSFLIISCYKFPKLNDCEIIKKCVIDTMYITKYPSTIMPDNLYNYKTECGEIITTSRNDVYKIGDTITYYKIKK